MSKFYVNIPRHYYDDIGDNFGFETYKEAREEAKKMVREALESLWVRGLTADDMLKIYRNEGDYPSIAPNEPNKDSFEAIIYAKQIATMICERLENQ